MLQGSSKIDRSGPSRPLADHRGLTAEEQAAAARAWRYFEANTQTDTGFVDSVTGFPSMTIWDLGSYLNALVAARRLGLVDQAKFEGRALRVLDSLSQMGLYDARLPNKAYDTRTLALVDYDNTPMEHGIGWSALDLGRLLVALRVLEVDDPALAQHIRAVLSGWSLHDFARGGELWGTTVSEGSVLNAQEGRIGYEQYAARAAVLWGLDAIPAASAERIVEWQTVEGVEVATDIRKPSVFRAIDPVVSEPYLMQAFEMGLDSEARVLAGRVYNAQEARWRATGHLTAVSEDHIDQEPHFLYASIYSADGAWSVVSEDGALYPDLRTQSTKASFGWDALYDTDYTNLLVAAVSNIGDPDKGWPAGIYEADGRVNEVYTLNTNAMILEALHYKAYGPLLALSQ
jgi:hypothetical protein